MSLSLNPNPLTSLYQNTPPLSKKTQTATQPNPAQPSSPASNPPNPAPLRGQSPPPSTQERRKTWDPNAIFSKEKFVTYFVEFIPEEWTPELLLQAIRKWEPAVDVFIPRKRSIRNSRFGFARFTKNDSYEARRLERLNTAHFDGRRLSFSLARYKVRGIFTRTPHTVARDKSRLVGPGRDENRDTEGRRRLGGPGDGKRSFAAVVGGNTDRMGSPAKLHEVYVDPPEEISYLPIITVTDL